MPRRVRNPSLAQDLFVLGDLYLTLGWLAFQRLRHGPLWPWDVPPRRPKATVLTLVRREEEEAAESARTVSSERG